MDFAGKRHALVEHLKTEIRDKRVLDAMERIPRECFISEKYAEYAYVNEPLPIGFNQTISQPLIIAIMTQALNLKGGEKILEIGTGSGYQTAILAELGKEVISVERLPELANSARNILNCLGYTNFRVFAADDKLGYTEEAPYDRIMVTAGAPHIPGDLIDQLSVNGIMVIPVGSRFTQELFQIIKLEKTVVTNNLGGCRFVPLIGSDAWNE